MQTLAVIENPAVFIDGNTTISEVESTILIADGANFYVWLLWETAASITISHKETTTYSVVEI